MSTRQKTLAGSLCMLMAVLAVPVEADFSDPPRHDTFESKAKFQIQLEPAFGGGVWDTPILRDPDTTVLRSDPHTEGSEPALPGATVGGTSGLPGDDGTRTIHDDEMIFPDVWNESPDTRREVHTELYDLVATAPGWEMRAGFNQIGMKSPGEVASQDPTGTEALDFPADSFFDVYFEVDVPGLGTVYNKLRNPLIVKLEGIDEFPPLGGGYVHDFGTDNYAIPIYFKPTDEFVGCLMKGLHGVRVTDTWLNDAFADAPTGIYVPVPGSLTLALIGLGYSTWRLRRRRALR